MKTVIPPIPSLRIFEDAAKCFASEPGDDTLCFGVQLWTVEQIQEQRGLAPGKLIAFQAELLNAENTPFRNEAYISKLRRFDEVWDYSEHNLEYLRQQGLACVRHVPLLPSKALVDAPVVKDIDLLHYGTWTRHRTDLLNAILAKGYKVYDVLREHGKWVFGEELHQLILRSKVVLGTHSYPQSSIQESFRYQYPLSNGIEVLAEKSVSNPLNLIEFADAEDMTRLLEEKGFERVPDPLFFLSHCFFPSYNSYQEEAEKNVGPGPLDRKADYALHRMDEDSLLMSQLQEKGLRAKEVDILSAKLFDALMWLTLRGKKTDETETLMKTIYHRMNRTALRKKLMATGGKKMPRLRCALLLHGWTLFKGSIGMAVKLHKEDKWIHYLNL